MRRWKISMGALWVIGAVGTANCCGVVLLCICCIACAHVHRRFIPSAMLIGQSRINQWSQSSRPEWKYMAPFARVIWNCSKTHKTTAHFPKELLQNWLSQTLKKANLKSLPACQCTAPAHSEEAHYILCHEEHPHLQARPVAPWYLAIGKIENALSAHPKLISSVQRQTVSI